jgi:replicative DNA helicase
LNISDIKNIESEAGVIATILQKPEYIFHCEQLKPNHFIDPQNAYIYYAVYELAKRGIEKIDAYNITNVLNAKESTKKQTDILTVQVLNELIDISPVICRETVEEYKLLADNVLNKAFRRETVKKLRECEKLCFSTDENQNIQSEIYQTIEGVITQFQNLDDVKPLSDQIDLSGQP